MTRDELIECIQAEHTLISRALDAIPPETVQTRIVNEGWTAKDVLGHIGYWVSQGVERARTAQRGEPVNPFFSGPDYDKQIAERNAAEAERRKKWMLVHVRDEYDGVTRSLIAEIRQMSEELLNSRPPGAMPPDFLLAKSLWAFGVDHPHEHLAMLQAAARESA